MFGQPFPMEQATPPSHSETQTGFLTHHAPSHLCSSLRHNSRQRAAPPVSSPSVPTASASDRPRALSMPSDSKGVEDEAIWGSTNAIFRPLTCLESPSDSGNHFLRTGVEIHFQLAQHIRDPAGRGGSGARAGAQIRRSPRLRSAAGLPHPLRRTRTSRRRGQRRHLGPRRQSK